MEARESPEVPYMSDSYPTIQDSLSEIQKEFMGCVEMHLDPPEHDDPSYRVEARYRADEDVDVELPASELVFAVSVDEHDEDISERRHTIEFVSGDEDRPRGWVRHVMKRVEGGNGRFFWTESRFEVAGPGIPERVAREEEVEVEVRDFVEKIRALDRHRKLVEVY
jgi:hypothetical protein